MTVLPVTMFDESVLPQGALNALNILTVLIVGALLPLLIWRAYKRNKLYEELNRNYHEEDKEKKSE